MGKVLQNLPRISLCNQYKTTNVFFNAGCIGEISTIAEGEPYDRTEIIQQIGGVLSQYFTRDTQPIEIEAIVWFFIALPFNDHLC